MGLLVTTIVMGCLMATFLYAVPLATIVATEPKILLDMGLGLWECLESRFDGRENEE